jgi:TorA maturation chaperone TorD
MNTQISVMQWQLSFDEELDADRIQQMQTRNQSEPLQGEKRADDDKEMEEKLISEMEAAPEIFD